MKFHMFVRVILAGLVVTGINKGINTGINIASAGVDMASAGSFQLVTPQDSDNLQDPDSAQDADDHETARDAHRESELVPYGRIQSAVQEKFTGRVVYQSLSPGKDGGWVYELKVLKDDGHVLMVFVDASSGEVLKTKGKN